MQDNKVAYAPAEEYHYGPNQQNNFALQGSPPSQPMQQQPQMMAPGQAQFHPQPTGLIVQQPLPGIQQTVV